MGQEMICGVMSSPNFTSSISAILQNSPNSQKSVMKISSRLRANLTTFGSTNGLKPAPLALLPPIPLYRRLLRAHRKYLEPQMRLLGDEYIKSEYRSHRNVENPMHIVSLTLYRYCWQTRSTLGELKISTDWILNGMADVRSEYRGRLLERAENRQEQDRQDERYDTFDLRM